MDWPVKLLKKHRYIFIIFITLAHANQHLIIFILVHNGENFRIFTHCNKKVFSNINFFSCIKIFLSLLVSLRFFFEAILSPLDIIMR